MQYTLPPTAIGLPLLAYTIWSAWTWHRAWRGDAQWHLASALNALAFGPFVTALTVYIAGYPRTNLTAEFVLWLASLSITLGLVFERALHLRTGFQLVQPNREILKKGPIRFTLMVAALIAIECLFIVLTYQRDYQAPFCIGRRCKGFEPVIGSYESVFATVYVSSISHMLFVLLGCTGVRALAELSRRGPAASQDLPSS